MDGKSAQLEKMRWVMFYTFISLYVLIVIGTLLSLWFGIGQITREERSWLFRGFIVEIGLAIIALFYSIFGLKRAMKEKRKETIRLIPPDEDIKKFLNKKPVFIPYLSHEILGEPIKNLGVTNDKDPQCSISIPEDTSSVYVSVEVGTDLYEGSFMPNEYYVEMKKTRGE